jgi:5-methylcytosine-specific restriction endonuclease McrA
MGVSYRSTIIGRIDSLTGPTEGWRPAGRLRAEGPGQPTGPPRIVNLGEFSSYLDAERAICEWWTKGRHLDLPADACIAYRVTDAVAYTRPGQPLEEPLAHLYWERVALGAVPSGVPETGRRFVVQVRSGSELLPVPWLVVEDVPLETLRDDVQDLLSYTGYAARYQAEFGEHTWMSITYDSSWKGDDLDTVTCPRVRFDELLRLPRMSETRTCQCGCGETFEVPLAGSGRNRRTATRACRLRLQGARDLPLFRERPILLSSDLAGIVEADTTATPRFIQDCCANCDAPLPATVTGLYCSELCTQTAEWVRYARRVMRDERANDDEVRYAVSIRLAHILGGGYAKDQRRLSPEVRAAVIERDGGRCRLCGAEGTEIDHIESSSADLANLQLVCRACHRSKTEQMLEPSPQEARLAGAALWSRVEARQPLRLCDDQEAWRKVWTRLKSERQSRLKVNLGLESD